MDIVVGDLLTIKGEKYITMDIVKYNGINYAFVNKMTNVEEPTKEFYTLEVLNNGVKIVTNKEILDILLPMFSKTVQKMVDEINEKGINEDI